MSYTRVLVPLDGSDRALAALGPARRLARPHRAELGLVTVAAPDAAADEADVVVDAGRRAAGDPEAPGMILRATDIASELARLDRDRPEFLLCMTTRARRPLGRAVLGSIAREVVRRSDQAISLVGPRCDVANTRDIRRLLVCLDGTVQGEAILPWAKRWSSTTGVELVLVRVVYPLVDPAARIAPTESQLDELGYVRRIGLDLERDGYRVADVTVQHPFAPMRSRTLLQISPMHSWPCRRLMPVRYLKPSKAAPSPR